MPACLPKGYFYSPSTYSTSNQQFVRDTVREFYERFGATCPAEDQQTELLIAQNRQLKQRCGSVSLQYLRDALQLCRSVIDTFIEISYDMLNIEVNILTLLAPLDAAYQQAVAQDILFWMREFITDSMEAITQTAQLLFRVVMDLSPFGKVCQQSVRVILQAKPG